MFVEYIKQTVLHDRWVVNIVVQDHPRLFEKGDTGHDFIQPVTDFIKRISQTASVIFEKDEWGYDRTNVQVIFFNKNEADQFLARFHHG